MGSRLSSREGVGGSEIKRGRERERDRGREEARRKASETESDEEIVRGSDRASV